MECRRSDELVGGEPPECIRARNVIRHRLSLRQDRTTDVVIRDVPIGIEAVPGILCSYRLCRCRQVVVLPVTPGIDHRIDAPSRGVADDISGFSGYGPAPLIEEDDVFERLIGQFDLCVAVRIARVRKCVFEDVIVVVELLAELQHASFHGQPEERIHHGYDHAIGRYIGIDAIVGHGCEALGQHAVHDHICGRMLAYHLE